MGNVLLTRALVEDLANSSIGYAVRHGRTTRGRLLYSSTCGRFPCHGACTRVTGAEGPFVQPGAVYGVLRRAIFGWLSIMARSLAGMQANIPRIKSSVVKAKHVLR